MPRKYLRKVNASLRASWTEEQLQTAVEKVQAGEISMREAHRRYNVPPRTLQRRMNTGNYEKTGLGPQGILGKENEKRLVSHIQRLVAAGFAPDRKAVRSLAYKFAQKLNIDHHFSAEKEMAGNAWLKSFLERNPELAIRQAEGLSLSRAQGMNKEDVKGFFNILEKVMSENDLLEKPSHIFNMDETGVQLINKPGKVITTKGVKAVHVLTSKERGENVTVIGCCSADGKCLPPVLIFKGVNRKPEFSDGLAGGSKNYMNKKSSFINSELFLKWLKEVFIPHKPSGKCLLILDGHTSHSTDIDMLEIADNNDIIILCLPSHCTQALQPLDRSFFGPFKTYFFQEAQLWMKNHSNRNFTRYQACEVIGRAWLRAASAANAVNGFRATGIYPLNPNAIPDHFFSLQNTAENPSGPHDINTSQLQGSTSSINAPRSASGINSIDEPQASTSSSQTSQLQRSTSSINAPRSASGINSIDEPQASTSSSQTSQLQGSTSSINAPRSASGINSIDEPQASTSSSQCEEELTPTKHLYEISPIPKMPIPFNKRRKQMATILTDPENMVKVREKGKQKSEGELNRKQKKQTKHTATSHQEEEKCVPGSSGIPKSRRARKQRTVEEREWSESDDEPLTKYSANNCLCLQCFEPYAKTTKTDDWIRCIRCLRWLHETCTMYGDICNICSRKDLRKKNADG